MSVTTELPMVMAFSSTGRSRFFGTVNSTLTTFPWGSIDVTLPMSTPSSETLLPG
jgi:hypothetical protein